MVILPREMVRRESHSDNRHEGNVSASGCHVRELQPAACHVLGECTKKGLTACRRKSLCPNAQERTRTSTSKKGHQALNLARLPIPPLALEAVLGKACAPQSVSANAFRRVGRKHTKGTGPVNGRLVRWKSLLGRNLSPVKISREDSVLVSAAICRTVPENQPMDLFLPHGVLESTSERSMR